MGTLAIGSSVLEFSLQDSQNSLGASDTAHPSAETPVDTAGALDELLQEPIHDQFGARRDVTMASDTDSIEDAGYETGPGSTSGTSLASSVTEYVWEYGRRYHAFRDGQYFFPNDEAEQHREREKHYLFKMVMNDQLFFAPLEVAPHNILDVGTGVGDWVIDVADIYVSARVLGIDLSPIQPIYVPPNAVFEVDDGEDTWLYRRHFDLIHFRNMIMGVRRWREMLQRAFKQLTPGGYVELQEITHVPFSSDSNTPISNNSPVALFWSLIYQGLAARDVDFHATRDGRMKRMLKECGFTNITETVIKVPIGDWHEDEKMQELGRLWRDILIDGAQAIALRPLMRGLKWQYNKVEVFLSEVRKGYRDTSTRMYMPLHVIYAQKPPLAASRDVTSNAA